ELTAALRSIWSGLYFADHIGATILPVGIRHGAFQPIFSLLVGGDWGASSSKSLALGYVIAMLLMLSACVFMVWGARAAECKHSVAALPTIYGVLFQIGTALMAGCFFAGESVAYRGIMLLLALPGLLLFSRPQVPTRLRRLSWITVILILLVMFRIPISGYLATHNVRVQNSAFAALIWMLFELAWWWIVSFLLML